MDVSRRRESGEVRRTITNVEFPHIDECNTIQEVREYLDWEAPVNPLPDEVKWNFYEDASTWAERKQSQIDRMQAEKESKRLAAMNPARDRQNNRQLLLEEFLAEKEGQIHPTAGIIHSEIVAAFEGQMVQRKLKHAPIAIYNELWDKFLEGS